MKTRKKVISILLTLFIAIIPLLIPFGSLSAATAYEQELQAKGFPSSYWAALTALHNAHPNWVFEAVAIDDDWATVISKETQDEDLNLVYKTSDRAWIKNYTVYDGSSWVPPTRNIVQYYMDPRNFLSEQNIFQFERLTFDATAQTAAGVNAIFGNNQAMQNMTPYIMEAAQAANISAYLLASRIKQEVYENSVYGITNSARGDLSVDYPPYVSGEKSICFMTPAEQKTKLESLASRTAQEQSWLDVLKTNLNASPIPVPSVRYFNVYNIGSTPNVNVVDGARINGIKYAMTTDANYNLPWDTQEKAVVGGAKYIANNYIAQGQNTMYFQKFAVTGTISNRYWHQYMQNLQAAASEGQRYYSGYSTAGMLGNSFTFRIPVYRNMPGSAVGSPFVIACNTQSGVLPGSAGQNVVTNGSYNIRSAASRSGTSLGMTGIGTSYAIQDIVTGETVSSYGNQWYKIQYNGSTAYLIVDLNGQTVPVQVSFDSQGGSGVSPVTVNKGSLLSAPSAPSRAGYVFGGWYKDAACKSAWNFNSDKPAGGTTLYAKWSAPLQVTYDSRGGSAVGSITVSQNSKLAAPSAPTRVGYTFSGWYKDTGCTSAWNFDTDTVTANTTLYAKWTIQDGVGYQTHVQYIGWQGSVSNGETSGTVGQGLRLEAIQISLGNIDGGITYSTHVQDYGWMNWVSDGATSGTLGESRRLEAIKIQLTGAAEANYDVYYRVHAQNFGWLGWAKNGEAAGTAGYGYRLEAIQIQLVKKGEAAPGSTDGAFRQYAGVNYQTHVQNIGWQSIVKDGATAGTIGQGLRLEAVKINLADVDGGIEYKTHVQNIGWMDWVSNDALSGTSGKSLRLEAIQIRLTGAAADQYDIYYRVHAQTFGWLDWAKNGDSSGTAGFAFRLEAIQVVLVPKGGAAPGATNRPFVQA